MQRQTTVIANFSRKELPPFDYTEWRSTLCKKMRAKEVTPARGEGEVGGLLLGCVGWGGERGDRECLLQAARDAQARLRQILVVRIGLPAMFKKDIPSNRRR